jgi:archaeosortase A (PGF-CTERM-specific)
MSVVYVLWLSLGLLVLAAALPASKVRFRSLVGGVGWLLFSVHWFLQPAHYLMIGDYFNAVATVVAGGLCVFFGVYLLRNPVLDAEHSRHVFRATSAAAIGGAIYFVFAEVPVFNYWLISMVTDQTAWLLGSMGFMPVRADWNILSLNGNRVEIILACTAIESIALFMGVTLACIDASFKRVAFAFVASVPVIYVLNLLRNVFVIAAYGLQWFGGADESFYIAHTVIAKVGSTIALFVIAYVVLDILPELLEMIDGITSLLKKSIKQCIGD